jgi:hypothetical protein
MMRGRLAAAALVVSVVARVQGQVEVGAGADYEARFGKPIDVSLTDLFNSPEAYEGKSIRVAGRMDMGPSFRSYVFSEAGVTVLLLPLPEVAPAFMEAAIQFVGQKVEVTGVFTRTQGNAEELQSRPRGAIEFWSYLGPPEEVKGPIKAPDVTLEALVTLPGRRDGQTIRVVGQFRGKNLYGDLPARSQRDSADWVIKDDVYAVWVSGRKPKGEGFALDAGLKRDTGKWLEVIGRPETRGGVTYLRAVRVSLASPPSATAQAQPPSPPPERPKVPPVVVFALPLDGETEVALDELFWVQFSKDMDKTSFDGRVVLRYAGPVLPGDRGFGDVRLEYDEGRRALIVDPGDRLRPGRDLELLLLPGIADIDGLPLIPRNGGADEEAVDVLRFSISG